MNSSAQAARAAARTRSSDGRPLAVGDVLAHARVEEDRLLRHEADLAAQRPERRVAQVHAVERDAPASGS